MTAGAIEVIPDEISSNELNECLAVVADLLFEGVGQNRVGKNQNQDEGTQPASRIAITMLERAKRLRSCALRPAITGRSWSRTSPSKCVSSVPTLYSVGFAGCSFARMTRLSSRARPASLLPARGSCGGARGHEAAESVHALAEPLKKGRPSDGGSVFHPQK